MSSGHVDFGSSRLRLEASRGARSTLARVWGPLILGSVRSGSASANVRFGRSGSASATVGRSALGTLSPGTIGLALGTLSLGSIGLARGTLSLGSIGLARGTLSLGSIGLYDSCLRYRRFCLDGDLATVGLVCVMLLLMTTPIDIWSS